MTAPAVTLEQLREAIAAGKAAGAAAGPGGIDPGTCPYQVDDPRRMLWSRWAVDAWLTSLGWPTGQDGPEEDPADPAAPSAG